jgi:hypothetical protein
LSTLPGLDEGVKDEAYREGLAAGDAVVKALTLGWAKTPKENTKKAWAPIVAKYAGDQEFMNDSQWAKGFGSALTGHYGKEMKLEFIAPLVRGAIAVAKSPAGRAAASAVGQYAAKAIGRAVVQKVDAAQLSPGKYHDEHGKCPPGYRRNKADTKCVPAGKTESSSLLALAARVRMSKTEAEEDVAATILKQMGGFGRLKAMIGAKNFSKTADSLTFQWPSKQRSTGNALKVTLKGDDTYDMEFFNGPKSVKKYDGVYNDQLKSIFEKQTGLYLTMSATNEGEPLEEASEVESKDDLPAYAQHNVKRVEKMFGVKYSTAWAGGNGIILVFDLQNPPRIVKETLKSLADLADFRWVEFNKDDISIGC